MADVSRETSAIFMFRLKKKSQALSGAIQAYNRVVPEGHRVSYQDVVNGLRTDKELDRAIKSLKTIKAFNRKMQNLNLPNKIMFSYGDISGDLSSAKTVKQFNTRLERFFRPGAEKIVKLNSNLSATSWEIKEFEYARRAANKNRAILQAEYREGKSAHGLQYDWWKYSPFQVKASSTATRRDFLGFFETYREEARPNYVDEQFNKYREKLIKSIDWMSEYPEYDELVNLFLNTPRQKIFDATNDPYSPYHIAFNYPAKGADEEAKIIYAQTVYERWKRRLL